MNGQSQVSEKINADGGIVRAIATSEVPWKRPHSQAGLGRVLILDGNTRSALAATRSLGRKGVHVIVADVAKRTLSSASRYCVESFTYPPPAGNVEGFLAIVRKECSLRRVGVILPMTELSTAIVLRHREDFRSSKVPFVGLEAFNALTDKWNLLKLAQELHLTIPKTHFMSGIHAIDAICQVLTFPVVLKPHCSTIWSHGLWMSTSVHYARSAEELKKIAAGYEYFNEHPFLIQEYISGRGEGVFALYDHGKSIAFFAHRRLRERPPTGGVSVVSESIEPNPEAQRMARTLLDHVGWHGVAMVEFKVSADGTPYLMEVNGRFWGSLQLAIDAGMDFPWLLYQMALGKEIGQVEPYVTGIKCRWLLGDFVRLWKVLINSESCPQAVPFGKVQSVLQFLNFYEKASAYEINRWDDLKPFWVEMTQYIKAAVSNSIRRRL